MTAEPAEVCVNNIMVGVLAFASLCSDFSKHARSLEIGYGVLTIPSTLFNSIATVPSSSHTVLVPYGLPSFLGLSCP
ncbi:hypothetical protein V6N13_045261 [Hibiscus sabdariffa]|uniref:Uncharacterized protein n=1 Tax=Hibiscus sabdariffa TaxID=183260 RepID=A0ABR2RKH2_9ROSI